MAEPARKKLLEVKDLRTWFDVEGRTARAVDGVSFDVFENEVFGLVGESGSGKSVTALSVMRLVPSPPGKIVEGSIRFRGRELLTLSIDEMHALRGRDVSMIFQEPMTALNPVFTIGFQLFEAIRFHASLDRRQLRERAVEILELVGISDGMRLLKSYPHQLSGGMRQRVMIAMALVMHPALLIADEPTTALDVTIQAQILELMLDVRQRTGDASILLITHDLAVVAETCDRVAVMYGGVIQEVAAVGPLFAEPLHPYTRGLMASLPRPGRGRKGRLSTIPGIVPSLLEMPKGCKFADRCPEANQRCEREEPALLEVRPGHLCRCHLVERQGGEAS